MVEVAVLGYGTVGQGVVNVLMTNAQSIEKKVGASVHVKYVLDLRDFPGTPVEKIVTHDFNDILNDESVDIVVETMGGLKPAYDFTKAALEAGKNVCTSNKELVAEHGVELCSIATAHSVNYMFEASCGGGIPIIRALNTSLMGEKIEMISGILNGTTNYIMTSMYEHGSNFDDCLKQAQELGYAELHPEADIEGHDAQRKIAILSSLAYGKHMDYKDVPTEGITSIDAVDMEYAHKMGMKIKLLATSKVTEEGIWAMVAPNLIGRDNILYSVDDVLNAVFVQGNCLGPAMFYGSGAGSLPTASAVVGDILDCAKNLHETVKKDITAEPLPLLAVDDVKNVFFVRVQADVDVEEVFGKVDKVLVKEDEYGFWTEKMAEKTFIEKTKQLPGFIKFIRKG